MTKRHKCPKCAYQKSYVVRRGKVRCLRCLYEWRPNRLPLQLQASEWEKIISGLLQDYSSQKIAENTGINRWRVMRALSRARAAMLQELRRDSSVFQLFRRGDRAWELMRPLLKDQTLIPLFSRKIQRGVAAFPGSWGAFSRLAARTLSLGGGKQLEKYLEDQFSLKRGIRVENWPLFFAEYAWRYRHRHLKVSEQVGEIIKLLKQQNQGDFGG